MSELIRRIAMARRNSLLSIVILFAVATASADEDSSDQLQRCALVEDASARLACYDGLIDKTQPAAAKPAKSSDSSLVDEVVDAPAPESDSEVARAPKQGRYEPIGFRATVTHCRQDSNKKYYFYLENGEVWKQSDRKKLKYKDCAFDISVTKDFFGYKMQQDGVDRRIRITRVK